MKYLESRYTYDKNDFKNKIWFKGKKLLFVGESELAEGETEEIEHNPFTVGKKYTILDHNRQYDYNKDGKMINIKDIEQVKLENDSGSDRWWWIDEVTNWFTHDRTFNDYLVRKNGDKFGI